MFFWTSIRGFQSNAEVAPQAEPRVSAKVEAASKGGTVTLLASQSGSFTSADSHKY